MFFANVEYMREKAEKTLEYESRIRSVKIIILTFGRVGSLDTTALKVLKELIQVWNKRGLKVLIADAKGEVAFVVKDHFLELLAQVHSQLTFDEALLEASVVLEEEEEGKEGRDERLEGSSRGGVTLSISRRMLSGADLAGAVAALKESGSGTITPVSSSSRPVSPSLV